MLELESIFRSIINFKNAEGKETLTQKELLKNFRSLQQIIPDPPEEKAYTSLYYFLYNHVKDCQGDIELPSYEILKHHFSMVEGSEAVLEVLEKIKVQQPYIGQDYKTILKSYNEEQRVLQLQKVVSDVSKIASTGLDIKNGIKKIKLKGIIDAVSYFARMTKDLQRSITGIKTESQIVSAEDATEAFAEYERSEANPNDSIGITTWLREMDDTLNGLKNRELMLVGGFTGHCKTTFAINMAYRALWQGWNTAFITLEMSFDEIRRKIYVLHACNPIQKVRFPKYKHLVGKIGYNSVRYGKLTKEEKDYYSLICKDFDDTVNKEAGSFGKFFIWQPEKSSTTASDIEFKTRQYQQELQAMGKNLDFLVIDYIYLMGADKDEKAKDGNETINNIIRTLKRMTLTFNNGKGIRILSPHQINREGYKEALKNEGVYYLTSLANTNEAERSSDVVISVFKFEEKNVASNRLKICGLKIRRDGAFSPFDACIDFNTGFIYNFQQVVELGENIDFSAVTSS